MWSTWVQQLYSGDQVCPKGTRATARAIDLAIGERLDGPISTGRVRRRLRRARSPTVLAQLIIDGCCCPTLWDLLVEIGACDLRDCLGLGLLELGVRDDAAVATFGRPRVLLRGAVGILPSAARI